jgi:hypothetical protein
MIHTLVFDNPGVLFLAVLCISLPALGRMRNAATSVEKICVVGGGIAVFAYVVLVLANVFRGGMLWHDEANILSIGAATLRGQPMYTAHGAAEFYSLFYGPYTSLIYVPFLALARNPLPWMRVAVSVADLLSLGCLYMALRAWLRPAVAMGLLSIAAALLLGRPNELLGFRGDPWMFLCVCAAVCLLMRSRGGIAAMLVAGVACGVAVDLKITVAPVCCVVLYALYRRRGARAGAMAAAGFVAAAVVVFFLPHISFANYIVSLEISAHQRFLRSTLLGNMVAAAMILSPLLMCFRNRSTSRLGSVGGMMWVLGGFALVVCVLTGSKESAGFWHLWPVLPLILLATARELARQQEDLTQHEAGTPGKRKTLRVGVLVAAVSVAGAVTTICFAAKDANVIVPLMQPAWKSPEAVALSELQRIARQPHAMNISMGYGGDVTDYRTNLRYVLPLAGQEYFFDENEVVEGIKEREPLPGEVLTRVLSCGDVWLVPHGDAPFSALRARIMPPGNSPYIFPKGLREGFVQTHRLVREGLVFDEWACKTGKP